MALPSYPFQRERYWLEASKQRRTDAARTVDVIGRQGGGDRVLRPATQCRGREGDRRLGATAAVPCGPGLRLDARGSQGPRIGL